MPGLWNQVATAAAATAALDVSETARLLAAVNLAMADAGIVAWETAYSTQFWRTETAIAIGGDGFFDTDGNIDTEGDVFWLPLIKSPSFPEYVSTQSAFSAAATAVLAEFLGDSLCFNLGSDINGDGSIDLTRSYTRFSQAADEAAQSSIFAGIQFGTSITDGQPIGANVADFVVNNHFALVPEPAGVLLGTLLMLPRRRASRCGIQVRHQQWAQNHGRQLVGQRFPEVSFVLLQSAPPESPAFAPGIKHDAVLKTLAFGGDDDAVVLEQRGTARGGEVQVQGLEIEPVQVREQIIPPLVA